MIVIVIIFMISRYSALMIFGISIKIMIMIKSKKGSRG